MEKSSQKVAFLVPSFRGGGLEKHALNLANKLCRTTGHQVDYLTVRSVGPLQNHLYGGVRHIQLGAEPLAPADEMIGASAYDIPPGTRPTMTEERTVPIRRYIEHNSPDVIISMHRLLGFATTAVQQSLNLREDIPKARHIIRESNAFNAKDLRLIV